jgi:O-antigen/teichoic acid export membrane protein
MAGQAREVATRHGDVTRRQIRGSSLLFGGQVFSVVVNLVTQVLIVRYLAKESYGAFAYALSVVTVAQVVAGLGLRRGVGRFMPIYEERGEPGLAAGTLVFALATVLSLGLAVVLLVAGLRGTIAGSVSGGDGVTVLVIMMLLVPVLAVGDVLDGAFAVFTRPRAILMRRFVLAPLMRLCAVGLLALSHSGVTFLAWGYVVTGVAGIAIYAPMLLPVMRDRGLLEHVRRDRLTMPIRAVMRFSAPLLSSDLTSAALNSSGPIVVGVLIGAAEVASLRAVLPVALTMGYVLTSFGHLFVPLASRLYARGDRVELNRLYWQTATWTTLLAYPIFIVALVLAEPLTVLLFGQRYESSASILAVLAVGQFVNAAAGHNTVLLAVFHRLRFIVLANAIAIIIDLALVVLLAHWHGALGAAIAMSVTYLILNALGQIGMARQTTVHALDRRYTSVWLVALLAAGTALVIQVALSPPLAIGIAMCVLSSAAVLTWSVRRLHVLETFPELRQLPLFRAILRAPAADD